MADEETTVVKAAMVSVNAGLTQPKALAKAMEAAMSQAVTDALADGVSIDDSDEIRSRMLAARQVVLDAVQSYQAAKGEDVFIDPNDITVTGEDR